MTTTTAQERAAAHRDKMARKAARPRLVYTTLDGMPANINRHTGKPHEHRAERARNGAL